ncbi:MAG: ABC transporter permease [Candidatus Hadarchaeota archaeon]
MKLKSVFGRIRKDYFVLIGATIALTLIGSYMVPQFLTIGHQLNLFRRNAVVGVLSLAQTLAILTSGIDLSVGANMVTVGIISGLTFSAFSGTSIIVPLILLIALGTIIGLLNGVGIGVLRVPPVIMTLGVMTALSGATLIYTGGTFRGAVPDSLVNFVRAEVGGLPVNGLVWVFLTIVVWLLLRKTKMGREIYALGSNPVSSYYSGIQTRKIKVTVYVLAGFLVAIAALLQVGRVRTISLQTAPAGIGLGFLLSSLTVTVIGGTTFRGGEGGVIGTLIATFLYGSLRSVLLVLGFQEPAIRIFSGLVIIVVLVLRGKISR